LQSQPALGTATEPIKPQRPDAAGSVQIDIVPLIRSLIKHATRPKRDEAIQNTGYIPERPLPPAAVNPSQPKIVAPLVALEPPAVVTQPLLDTAAHPERRFVPAVAPTPAHRHLAATKFGVVQRTNEPKLPPTRVPDQSEQQHSTATVPMSANPASNPVGSEPGEPLVRRYRIWLIATMLGLFTLAIAAGLGAIRYRRLVRRTRSMLKIEPQLDLSRSECHVSSLTFAGASDA